MLKPTLYPSQAEALEEAQRILLARQNFNETLARFIHSADDKDVLELAVQNKFIQNHETSPDIQSTEGQTLVAIMRQSGLSSIFADMTNYRNGLKILNEPAESIDKLYLLMRYLYEKERFDIQASDKEEFDKIRDKKEKKQFQKYLTDRKNNQNSFFCELEHHQAIVELLEPFISMKCKELLDNMKVSYSTSSSTLLTFEVKYKTTISHLSKAEAIIHECFFQLKNHLSLRLENHLSLTSDLLDTDVLNKQMELQSKHMALVLVSKELPSFSLKETGYYAVYTHYFDLKSKAENLLKECEDFREQLKRKLNETKTQQEETKQILEDTTSKPVTKKKKPKKKKPKNQKSQSPKTEQKPEEQSKDISSSSEVLIKPAEQQAEHVEPSLEQEADASLSDLKDYTYYVPSDSSKHPNFFQKATTEDTPAKVKSRFPEKVVRQLHNRKSFDWLQLLFESTKSNCTLSFDDLCKLVGKADGKITQGSGSRVSIRLKLYDNTGNQIYADAINPHPDDFQVDHDKVVLIKVDKPHGHGKDNQRVPFYVVQLFRDAFMRAGITPKEIEREYADLAASDERSLTVPKGLP